MNRNLVLLLITAFALASGFLIRGQFRHFSSTNSCRQEPIKDPGFDIIIIAGQSNASGQGVGPNSGRPIENESSLLLQMGRIGENQLKIIPAVDPLDHWDREKHINDGRIGFAIPFARLYAKKYLVSGRRVLLVPTASGGSNILAWAPSAPDEVLFKDMVVRARLSLETIIPESKFRNRIVAVLWHQGEANLFEWKFRPDMQWARAIPIRAYGERLRQIVETLQSEFPDERFPFLIGEINQAVFPGDPIRVNFDKELQRIEKEIPCTGLVPSDGLKNNSEFIPNDGEHFSAEALVQFGARYFKKFGEIVD